MICYVHFVYLSYQDIRQLPDMTFNGRRYSPPDRTPYNGFILSSPSGLLSKPGNDDKGAIEYYLKASGRHDALGSYSLESDSLLINRKYRLTAKEVDYYSLDNKEVVLIMFKDKSLKIFLKLSNYNDNVYIFDPIYGYVFLFEGDFLKNWTGRVYEE